jgi:hypothetical protein
MTILFIDKSNIGIYTAFIKDVSMYHRYENNNRKIINLLHKLIYKFNLKCYQGPNSFIWANPNIQIHTQTNPLNGLKFNMNTNNQINFTTSRVGDFGNILIKSKIDNYIDIFIDSLQEIVDDVLLEDDDNNIVPGMFQFYNEFPSTYYDEDSIIVDM